MSETLNQYRDRIYADAVAHGLWENGGGALAYLSAARMILDESLELLEAAHHLDTAYRTGDLEAIHLCFKHFCEELADVMIGSLSSCGEMGIDADMIVGLKMEVNQGRSYKHEHDGV